METYLTADEVAMFVKLSVQTIRRYTMKKEIPFHKIGRAVRYKKSEIEQWVEKRDVNSAKEQGGNGGGLFGDTAGGGKV